MLLLLTVACVGRGGPAAPEPERIEAAAPPGPTPAFRVDPAVDGLVVRLVDASPPEPEVVGAPLVLEGARLASGAVDALLDRVPPLEEQDGDRRTFALRKGSRPPPRAGADVRETFPPAPSPPPPEVSPGAPRVVRFAPEGEVPLASAVAVTFDQPMVAVTSQEEAARTVPVTLTPQPPGSWRWLGTKTLLFDADPRLPMATEFVVEVPAGTASATGGRLAEPFRATFATPPPTLVSSWPLEGVPVELEPTVVLRFDQRMDPVAVIERLEVSGADVRLRLATDEERSEAVARQSWMARDAAPGSIVALRPVDPLPKDTTLHLKVPRGTPSGEGPRGTTADAFASFSTYGPLRVVRHGCDGACPPAARWSVRTNNPLDPSRFDAAAWRVSPPVADLVVSPGGSGVSVGGTFEPRTVYTLTAPGSLTDVFGQTLGRDQELVVRVGPAERSLTAPGQAHVVLDPAGGAKLPVWSVNHPRLEVEIAEVTPEDWGAWRRWLYREDERQGRAPAPFPGRRVFSGTLETGAEPDRRKETPLDLSPHLGPDGVGHFVVRVEAPGPRAREVAGIYRWVQVTDLGLVGFADADRLVGWATDLATGASASGVSLSFLGREEAAITGPDGLAELRLPLMRQELPVLVARRGADVALLPDEVGHGWIRRADLEQRRWYVADDRGLYRPGETARIKGWVRRWEPGPEGDLGPIGDVEGGAVGWTLKSARGHALGEGRAEITELGGFHLEVPLPEDVDLGVAQLSLSVAGDRYAWIGSIEHAIRIAEFRRPEFEVKASFDEGPHLLGLDARVDLTAAWFAGGGLVGAQTRWTVRADEVAWSPPGSKDHHFGSGRPWERSARRRPGVGGVGVVGELEAVTDDRGEHHLGLRVESLSPPRPMRVTAEAVVTDVNRQAWAARATTVVHPSDRYVGLKLERGFVRQGEPVEVEVLVVDLEGRPAPGAATDVTLARRTWARGGDGRWAPRDEEVARCAPTLDDEGLGACTFEAVPGGAHVVRARVADGHGRPNESELGVWVAGGPPEPSPSVDLERLTLVPEREELRIGDTARVLVQAPWVPAEGAWTVRRDGIERVVRFRMDEPTTVLELPVDDTLVPNFALNVHLVRALDDAGGPAPGAPSRIAHASGSVTFRVPPLERTLRVEVTPAEDTLAPGGETTLALSVRDARGEPVAGAEVAVVAVDESVLALTGYALPDPIAVLYTARQPGVTDHFLRSFLALGDARGRETASASDTSRSQVVTREFLNSVPVGRSYQSAVTLARGVTGGSGGNPNMAGAAYNENLPEGLDVPSELALRTDLDALALFAPEVRTGEDGTAEVALRLPDSLTRYRVMAVAAAGSRSFGRAEAAVTAREALMVRPSAPRFLNFGDQAELPVVVQNATDAPLTVDVAVRATNLAFVERVEPVTPDLGDAGVSTAGRRITVPAHDRVEVRFPAVTSMAGTARLQVVAAAGALGDATELSFPVWTPATTEAFATYGSIEAGAVVQPVEAPPGVWTQFGALEVTTGSTQLQELTDALIDLSRSPYESNEHLASRVLGVASLRDVLSAFGSPRLPSPAALDATVQADLRRLADRQHPNGGWSSWGRVDDEATWPYLSIHVANAYARARERGYAVPEESFRRAVEHLRRIEAHLSTDDSEESRAFLRAYALDVLRRMGHPDVRKARQLLLESGDLLGPDGLALLLPTLHEGGAAAEVTRIRATLGNRVTETAGAAHFVTRYRDGEQVLLASDRRADAIVLEALLETTPDDELAEKVVRGLLAARVNGLWANRNESAHVLMALDRYFRAHEAETPDFVARIWLGEEVVGDHTFRGRTTERALHEVPLGDLTEHRGPRPLTLQKDGADGRLYYRVGLRYAPRDLRLEPADRGFAVDRRYVAVDDPGDVRRDEDGTWRIRAGARVRVDVTMANDTRRHHVALVDPIAGGFEALNPALAVTEQLPEGSPDDDGRSWDRWWSRWYQHDQLRDERAEAFTSSLREGAHSYRYVVRATTPGRFVVPPARAEEMYMPETFGRSATDLVVVE